MAALRPAQRLHGITNAWLSIESFHETARVLNEAAIYGKIDYPRDPELRER